MVIKLAGTALERREQRRINDLYMKQKSNFRCYPADVRLREPKKKLDDSGIFRGLTMMV